jgi:hypothetical protein
MAVTLPRPPVESLTALQRALGEQPANVIPYAVTADPAPQWLAQKLFTAFVQDLAAGQRVNQCARDAGWRYLLRRPLDAIAADVRLDAQGRHRFDQFAAGPLALQTLQFTQQVVDEPRFAAGESYALQALVVPAVYVLALWLAHANPERDWFMPIAPTDQRLVVGRYYDAEQFNAILATLARERMQHETPET